MPYRVPGAYARFVKTASTVNNVGATRVLGLIGTGANYFEVYNEAIKRDDSQSYDSLAYPNVFEIISVTDKPLNNGAIVKGSVEYEEGKAFYLRDGDKLAWDTIQEGVYNVISQANERSLKLKQQIDIVVNDNKEYLIEDGSYTLEITYLEDAWDHADSAHVNCGCYRVTDNKTKKIVGEWGVSENWNLEAVPGLKIRITDVFVPDIEGESITKVGDSVTIVTQAPKTEIEPQINFDDSVPGWSQALQESFIAVNKEEVESPDNYEYFLVTDSDEVIDESYDLEVVDATTKEIQITRVSDNVVVYGPKYVGAVTEYLGIIPGITFLLPDIDNTLVNTGDTVRIQTTAAVFGESIAENNVYYVSYKFKKAEEDYDPKVFYEYDDVVEEYGNYDVTASSVVTNSLTLGAELAMTAGVNPIVCVQSKNDSAYEMKKAIDKLTRDVAGVRNVNAIVPLIGGQNIADYANIGSYCQSHVNTMSAETGRHERMVYLSAFPGQKINKAATAADKTLGMKQQAEAYNDERVVYVVPGRVTYDVKNIQTGRINTRTLPGSYLALGVATIAFTHDVAEPLTRKKIACGFNGLLDTYTENEKNALAESGCCVVHELSSGLIVRHGITTDDDEVNTTEITLIQIKDYVIEQVRYSCDEMYVGIKNLPSAKTNIKFTVNNILTQFVAQEIILGFSGPTVKDSPTDPREVLVNFEIEAVYPLNYITISFGFSSTGT